MFCLLVSADGVHALEGTIGVNKKKFYLCAKTPAGPDCSTKLGVRDAMLSAALTAQAQGKSLGLYFYDEPNMTCNNIANFKPLASLWIMP